MLCARVTKLEIIFGAMKASGTSGSAHGEAKYIFSWTGRAAHNIINGSFVLLGDKIVRHMDHFSLWK
jgi:hypothetical protein